MHPATQRFERILVAVCDIRNAVQVQHDAGHFGYLRMWMCLHRQIDETSVGLHVDLRKLASVKRLRQLPENGHQCTTIRTICVIEKHDRHILDVVAKKGWLIGTHLLWKKVFGT